MTRSFTKIMETAEAQDFWAASCGRLNVKECPHRDNIPQSLLLPVGICTHSFGDRHPQFRLTSVYHNLEYPEIILNHIKNTRLESTLVMCFWQLLFLLWFCQLVQISCRCHWVGGRWDRGALRYWPASWFSSWHPICHPVVGHFIGHPFGHPDYHPLGYPDCHPICHPVLGHVVDRPVSFLS